MVYINPRGAAALAGLAPLFGGTDVVNWLLMQNEAMARGENLFVQWLGVDEKIFSSDPEWAIKNPALKFGHALMEAGKISQAARHFESVLQSPSSHFDLMAACLLASKAHTLMADFGVSFGYLETVLHEIKMDVSRFRWIPPYYDALSFLTYMTGSPRSLPQALAGTLVSMSLDDKQAAARGALELVIMQGKFGVGAYQISGELQELIDVAMKEDASSLAIWRAAAEGKARLAELPMSLREMVLSAAVKVYRGPAMLLPPFARLKNVTQIYDKSANLHIDLNDKSYISEFTEETVPVDHRQIITF
jgi:hypothetical protein